MDSLQVNATTRTVTRVTLSGAALTVATNRRAQAAAEETQRTARTARVTAARTALAAIATRIKDGTATAQDRADAVKYFLNRDGLDAG